MGVLRLHVCLLVDEEALEESVHRYVEDRHEDRCDCQGGQCYHYQHVDRLLDVLVDASHVADEKVEEEGGQPRYQQPSHHRQQPAHDCHYCEPEGVGYEQS